LGKYGAFLACNNYPDCNYKKALMKLEGEAEQDNIPLDNSRELGTNADGVMVYLNRGPYGWYVQLGKALDKKTKPKRCQLPANMKPDEVTLAFADYLLKMPIEFGIHPDTGEKIMLGIGRFGPYLKYQDAFYSISRAFNAFALTMEQAQMILSKPKKPKAAKEPVAPKKASSKAKTTKTTKTKAPAKKS
jgi:DNA topoisomerase-1